MRRYFLNQRSRFSTEDDNKDSADGNDKRAVNEKNIDGEVEDLITVSHFLPLQALCPEKRFLLTPELTKVVGSDALAHQVMVA
jgi:hypothetical protein